MEATKTTEKPDTYNGWANRETWAFSLWIRNDEGLDQMAQAFAESVKGDFSDGDSRKVTDTQAQAFGEDIIDQLYQSISPQKSAASMAESALRDIGSTWRIDWREIAAMLDEYNES